MLGRSSGNQDWLFVNASACVQPGFHPNATHATQSTAFGWKPGFSPVGQYPLLGTVASMWSHLCVFVESWVQNVVDRTALGMNELLQPVPDCDKQTDRQTVCVQNVIRHYQC